MREWVSHTFWSTYHDSDAVKAELDRLLDGLEEGQIALNVGSGQSELLGRLVNLDKQLTTQTDCVADALHLPFNQATFDLIISQETIEHVADPFRVVRQMERVLRHNGVLYLQVPFVLGYHPDPDDFWRFTHSGVRRILEQAGLRCDRVGISLAAGTGLHRIVVEFTADLAARVIPRAYLPTKGAMAILFYPLKWFDGWLSSGRQRERIAGGFFGIGRKTA